MANLTFLHGGNIYEVKSKFKKEIIDFSANINPLGLPLRAKRTIYENFDKILHYPDPNSRNITRKIAKYWGINEKNVLLGNGSVELIYLIMSTYRPETTLVPAPTFSEYERAAKSVKSRMRFLKLREKNGFELEQPSPLWGEGKPPALRADRPGGGEGDILFLCNPNNPTGNLVVKNRGTIGKFAGKLVVVDEAFMDFLPDQKDYTLIWKAVKKRKIVVLRTLTKFFALPGLRIGYLIAHEEIVNKLKQHQVPWSTNSLAQIAAEEILNDKEYINKTYKLIREERDFLFRQLAKTEGLKPYSSVTNFLLVKIEKTGITSKSLKELLIEKGILIRDCSNFRNLNDKYIRVAVRSRKENLKLLAALKGVV